MRLTSSTACPSAVAWKPDVSIAPMIASSPRPLLKSWPTMTALSGVVSVGTSTAFFVVVFVCVHVRRRRRG